MYIDVLCGVTHSHRNLWYSPRNNVL